MKNRYKPISCASYDQLEELAVRKRLCDISYLEDNNIELSMKNRIVNIITKNKEEFLILENGTHIRLDKVIRINDIAIHKSC